MLPRPADMAGRPTKSSVLEQDQITTTTIQDEDSDPIGGLDEEEQDSLLSSSQTEAMELLDLPWEQVLCSHILPYLSIKETFSLRAVSHTCRELVETYFSINFVVNTSPLADNFTAAAFRIMTKHCGCLKVLSVRGAKSWLTTSDISPVLEYNEKLEKIDLSGCLALSGAAMYSIGLHCESLKYLSVRDCVWLTFDNFISFLLKERQLEFLDLSGCWNLDDELVVRLVSCCPRLKQLLLQNLYGLTDRSINALAHSCPDLTLLNIKGCWRVTDDAIRLLSQYCEKLKMLQVKECRDITEASLRPLRERKVHIDKLPPPSIDQFRLNRNQIKLNVAI